MANEVITLWIYIVLAHCVPIYSTGLTNIMSDANSKTTTITTSLSSTFAVFINKASSATFVRATFEAPISRRTEMFTLPFVFNIVRGVSPTPEIATTTTSEPPHIVEQGLVQFMPPLITIGSVNTQEEIVNKSNSNKKKGGNSRLDKDSLVYGNKSFADPVYNYVFPTVLGTCLLTTIIFMLMLGKRLMTASSQMSKASCLLLIAVAVADVLTITSALAEIGWLFSQTDSNMFLLPGSCRIMLILERISAIPHAASTWFTVILAIQRYMCVSKPFAAGRHITIKLSCFYIVTVSVLIIGLHTCRFFDQTFVTVYVQISTSLRNVTIGTCQCRYASWVKDPVMYESLFAWLRIALTQFSPCIFIVCFVYLLIRALSNTKHITKGMQIVDSKMSSNRRHLSLFVILVAFIVFCIEMPLGIFLSFNAWELSTGHEVFSYQSLKTASIALDLILYVSYFVIFLLYCLMSRDFRQTIFKTLIQTISE